MLRLRHHRSLGLLLTLLASPSLVACRSWQPQGLTTAIAPSTQVRVTRHDGSRVVLVDATVRGDSVHGYYFRPRAGDAPPVVSLPVSAVEKAEVQKFDGGRTFLLGAGVVVTAAVAVAAAAAAAMGSLLSGS